MTTRNKISCFVQGSIKRKIMYKIIHSPSFQGDSFVWLRPRKIKQDFSKVPASNAAWISNQICRTNTSWAGNSSFLSHFCIQGFEVFCLLFPFLCHRELVEKRKIWIQKMFLWCCIESVSLCFLFMILKLVTFDFIFLKLFLDPSNPPVFLPLYASLLPHHIQWVPATSDFCCCFNLLICLTWTSKYNNGFASP